MYRSKVYLTLGNTNLIPGERFEATKEQIENAIERGLVEKIGDIIEGELVEQSIKMIMPDQETKARIKEKVLNKITLEEAKKQYKEKFGKEVSNRYKNDLDYILSKINA